MNWFDTGLDMSIIIFPLIEVQCTRYDKLIFINGVNDCED